MSKRAELASSDQFTLHAMFEIIAGCALFFAVLPYRDLVLCTTVFAVLTVFLLRRGWGDARRVILLGVFAATSILLLSMSGVYHLLGPGPGRSVMRQLDISGVFVLIAAVDPTGGVDGDSGSFIGTNAGSLNV